MATHVKSAKWYAEANGIQQGWGNYLRKIDRLKDRVTRGQRISLKQFCWTLYGEGFTSHCWEAYEQFCVKRRLKHRRTSHSCWCKHFKPWVDNVYDPHKP